MNPHISHHHGTCDMCGEKHILIVMFGYNIENVEPFCICKDCFAINIQQIIYGFHKYKDGLINDEVMQ